MPVQSAIRSAVVTFTKTVTVAAGVFAPGHLGELTWQVPFELADAVLEETRRRERRLRVLPSRVGIYFVLALGLFPALGYQRVWAKLTAALDGQDVPCPSAKALRDLRRRLGAAPLKALFEVLAGPVAQPATPGIRFGRYRTVASGGCSSIKVPDTGRNRSWLGKLKAVRGVTGYPALELMTLAETGTRALAGAVFGPPATGETDYARQLLHLLDDTMLVLMDRGFDAGEFLREVAATRAQFLVRVTARRRLPVMARLDDGSFLPAIGDLPVRVVSAQVTVTCADGTTCTGGYRLATTLADHRRYPAAALTRLYHERWEHESACLALRHTLLEGRVLRPAGPRRAGTGNMGAAGPLPGAAPGHGHRHRNRARNRPRPRQLHRRPANSRPDTHPGRRHPSQRHQPGRPDRARRPGRPAPAPAASRQRPQGQIPAIPLEQHRSAPASPQHPHHQHDHHRQPPSRTSGTASREGLDGSARTLTTWPCR